MVIGDEGGVAGPRTAERPGELPSKAGVPESPSAAERRRARAHSVRVDIRTVLISDTTSGTSRQLAYSSTMCLGDIGTTLRELEWKNPTVSGRVVPKTPTAS